jgi:4-diphosphocytidyl-2-C-methyl-D-erythritol kinase
MVSFPNAKINIGLQVTEKRPDGYHNIQTIFYPIRLHDVLECLPLSSDQTENSFKQTGIPVLGDDTDNLCNRAYQLLKKYFPFIPPVYIHLHKTIPMGAGLGGGSADGTFMLSMLNDLFELAISPTQLSAWSLELGSDCPFFLMNKPSYAEGRGEILTPIEIDLSNYKILLINPGIHVPTGKMFAQLQPNRTAMDLRTAIQLPLDEWKSTIKNDFETVVFHLHPECKQIKNQLYESGALYASMSGSGSTFYGIYEKSAQPMIDFPERYFYKWV